MKKYLLLILLLVFIVSSHTALAKPYGKTIPEHAQKVSENVYFLGSKVDKSDGKKVDGYLIVHPRKGFKKPSGTPGGGGGGKGGKDAGSSCYAFMAKGAKWKGTPEAWVVNPANTYGMSDASVFSILNNGISKWEDAADGTTDDGGSLNILGSGAVTNATLEADYDQMDNQNEVYFGALDPGTIGVTVVWGIFGGSPRNRELREWDQVYNTYYDWTDSVTAVSGKMDFDNIATHELGHSFGLGDLYESGCSEETMYGYGDTGEISKRDLGVGDIIGISELY